MAKIIVLATSRHTHGGISSVVMAHEQTHEWHEYGCHWIATHRSGSKIMKLLYLAAALPRFIAALPGCRIVHIHTSAPPSAIRKSLFMKIARIARKKTIVHFHAFDTESTIDGPHREIYRRLFSNADNIVVLSESWRKAVCSTFPELASKITVLHNPCPSVDHDSNDMDQSHDSDTSGCILSAGVVNSRKGYRDLINAFARIAPTYPGWRLIFAGSGEIDEGRSLAATLGISDQICFTGWLAGKKKDRIFRNADILCLPSYSEGFPMAVLDAWAYGLPVVATPVGGLPDIVTDGEDILLFPPGDCEALASQLEKIISDTALRKKIAIASKNFANHTFNIKTIGRRLGEIYDSLLRQ